MKQDGKDTRYGTIAVFMDYASSLSPSGKENH
jgi:hypothetical protein